MIFGNNKTIAFHLHDRKEQFLIMDITINLVNISYLDNSYYIFPLVKNIKIEIDFIANNDLSLDKTLVNKPLDELYNIFYESEISVYKSNVEKIDVLFYDLSTKNSTFYIYQEQNLLVFFGAFIGDSEIITTRVYRDDFLNLLSSLLTSIEAIAIPWR